MSNFPKTKNGRTWKEAVADQREFNKSLFGKISTENLMKVGGYLAHAGPMAVVPQGCMPVAIVFMLPCAMQGILEELARRESLAEQAESN